MPSPLATALADDRVAEPNELMMTAHKFCLLSAVIERSTQVSFVHQGR